MLFINIYPGFSQVEPHCVGCCGHVGDVSAMPGRIGSQIDVEWYGQFFQLIWMTSFVYFAKAPSSWSVCGKTLRDLRVLLWQIVQHIVNLQKHFGSRVGFCCQPES